MDIKDCSVLAESATPLMSLIVCTKNRSEQLAVCLQHIAKLKAPFAWELIVVDNGSTDDTAQVVHDFLASFGSHGHYVYATQPGNGAGRNAGIARSAGSLLAFTDDDCYVEPDFLVEVARVFEAPSVGYMSGRIMLYDADDAPATINESLDPIHLGAREVVKGAVVQGANMAFRRQAVYDAGLFDPDFGAGAPFAGEDWELAMRVSAAGWAGGYYPGPTVWHHHGRKLKDVPKLVRFYTFGEGAVFAKGVLASPLRWPMLRYFMRRLAGDVLKRGEPIRLVLFMRGACAYWRLHKSRRNSLNPSTI